MKYCLTKQLGVKIVEKVIKNHKYEKITESLRVPTIMIKVQRLKLGGINFP